MDFLSQPQQLYSQITKGLESIWLVIKPDPCGKNMYLYAQEIEPNEGWHIAEDIIRNAANRYSKFNICVAVNKNAIQTNIPVTVVHQYGQQGGQVAGIGSVPSAGMSGYPGADIGKLIDEKIAAVNKEWEHKDELRRAKEEKEYWEAKAKERRLKSDPLEQISDLLEKHDVDLNPLINGIVRKFLSPAQPRPLPAVAGVSNIHRKTAAKEVPHETGEDDEPEFEPEVESTEEANTIAMNEAIYKELVYGHNVTDQNILNIDFAPVIYAVIALHKAGFDAEGEITASDLLVKVSNFVIERPLDAMKVMKQMNKDGN